MKKDLPGLQKREEQQHKDLDHDGERGEPAAHVQKVLGVSAAKAQAISKQSSTKPGNPRPFTPAPKPGPFGPKNPAKPAKPAKSPVKKGAK